MKIRYSRRILLAMATVVSATSPGWAEVDSEVAQLAALRERREGVISLDRFEVTDRRQDGALAYRGRSLTSTGFRAQPVLDTPYSVSSFSAEFIKDLQARSLLDLTRNDPSVAPAGDPLWFDRVYVRGFYLSVNAVFRDHLGINDQGSIALENKEAVEITKGLSAVRNGVTSPGGTLNYIVERPTAEPVTEFTVSGDGYGGFGGNVDLSRRFGSNREFGARINATAEEIRSFIDPVEGERTFLSGAFEWKVSERLLLETEFERQDREISTAQSPSLTSFANIEAARAFFPQLNAETRPTQPWAVEPNVQLYLSGRVSYQLAENWTVRASGHRATLDRDQRSVRAVNIRPNGDYDVSHYFAPDQERNNSAWQVVVEGDLETGTVAHELAFGYDYVRRDMIFGPAFSQVIGTSNLFREALLPNPAPTVGPAYLASRSDQDSLFFANTAKLSNRVHVTGGVRLTRLENLNGDATGQLTPAYDKDAVNPTAGLVVKLAPNLSLYANYAEGIEQGGVAPSTTVNAGQVFDPLESDQIEAGVKFELGRGALLTAAAFRIEKGLEFIDVSSNTYVQDGRQLHEGVELGLAGALTDRLRLIAGVAYLEAAVKRTANPALVGKRPQGVPEWQSNLVLDYDVSAWVDGLSFNVGAFSTGNRAIDQLNTWTADSYVRFDAGARYRQRIGDKTTLTYRVHVENLADERYVSDTSFGSLVFGSPRSVRFSATLAF